MDENNTFVTETEEEVVVAENTEQTVEETVTEPTKMFTQEDLNAAVGKAKARERAKLTKQYEKKYGNLMGVLKAGTGTDYDVDEMTDSLSRYYEGKGIKMPTTPEYNEEDLAVLANAEAEEIIRGGFEDVVEEADRLKEIGAANMTAREKAVFVALTNHIKATETTRELDSIGVPKSVSDSAEFKEFAGQFKDTVSMADVYKMYEKATKTSNIEPIGSMKNGNHGEEKTYYSPEDVDKLTPKDYDNPVIFQRVRESMKRW